MQKEVIEKLRASGTKIAQALMEKHKNTTKECLSFQRLLETAQKGMKLTEEENQHMESCPSCSEKLYQLSWKLLGEFQKEHFPSAAGSSEDFSHIPSSLLESLDLPGSPSLICENHPEGYELRLEGEVSVRVLLAFIREEEELYRLEVSEQLPQKIVPLRLIQGWTALRFYGVRS